MRRGGVFALALLVSLFGCGRRDQTSSEQLELETLPDTARLSEGKPLLTGIQPHRDASGALTIRGELAMPDGVRIEVSIYREGSDHVMSRVQVLTKDGSFETEPILHSGEPLPSGRYRFEYRALFNRAWQTEDVLARTDQGRLLRGPGITRDRVGGAAFYLIEERKL